MALKSEETSGSARTAPVFDVGIDERVPIPGAIGLGVQNILGMAGLLIFPALIGTAFKLPHSDIAYLYGVTFMTSGLVVILQSVLLLRLPIVQGPYAGSLAAVLAVGHAKGGQPRRGVRFDGHRGPDLVRTHRPDPEVRADHIPEPLRTRPDHLRRHRLDPGHPADEHGPAELARHAAEPGLRRRGEPG
ncbi:MAG: hypothetical protein ACRDP6_40490, partial [Actinoallomurus sp.]